MHELIPERSRPARAFSNCGVDYAGPYRVRDSAGRDRELNENFKAVCNSKEMHAKCSQIGILWKFNPLSAPHFGGMQEAGVKSVEHHLKRIIGEFTPTGEELQTLLCKIEASLNSRPIAPLSENPDDYAPLTPGHFLTGGPLNAFPV
ncbi:uncharacterized protein LOC144477973, partial [Augochlora pura]